MNRINIRFQYVPEGLLQIYKDKIVSLADVIVPNQFEAEYVLNIFLHFYEYEPIYSMIFLLTKWVLIFLFDPRLIHISTCLDIKWIVGKHD